MIKVQNISTGEVVNVLNVVVENNQIISEARRPNKGTRFYNSYPMVLPAGQAEDGRDLHVLAEGWELASKGTRKPRQPKQESVKQEEQVREEETVKTNDEQEVKDDAKQEESVPMQEEQPQDVNDDDVNAIASMLLKLKKGSAPVNKDMVVAIVREESSMHPLVISVLANLRRHIGMKPSQSDSTTRASLPSRYRRAVKRYKANPPIIMETAPPTTARNIVHRNSFSLR